MRQASDSFSTKVAIRLEPQNRSYCSNQLLWSLISNRTKGGSHTVALLHTHLASPPDSAAAGEPIWDPGVFTTIIIFFPYWWLSCNKLFSLLVKKCRSIQVTKVQKLLCQRLVPCLKFPKYIYVGHPTKAYNKLISSLARHFQSGGWWMTKHGWYRTKPIFTNLKKRFEHIQLPAKLLDYLLRGNKSNINQS